MRINDRAGQKGEKMIEELVKRYPVLESVKGQIEDAYKILETCYENGGKLLIAGNGGSAADSDHIVGELMKGFVKRRPVSAELAEALKQADPERGEELAKKLQGGPSQIIRLSPPHSQTMWMECSLTHSR